MSIPEQLDEELGPVARLEMRVAEQERVIEELSGEVARQWQALDRLERQADRLAERFRSVEDALPAAPPAKPPHW